MADELTGGGGAGMETGVEAPSPAPTEAVEPTSAAETDAPRDGAQTRADLEDEDDDDVYDEEQLMQDREKLRRLIRNRRRDGRFAKENRALVQRIRDSKLDLDDLVWRARNHDALAERIAALPPELKARIFSDHAPASQPEAPARPEYPGPGLPEQIPFDTNDPGGQYIAQLHRGVTEFHRQSWEFQQEVKDVIRKLASEVGELRQGITGEKTQQLTRTWAAAIDQAVGQYDDAIAPYLRDGLVGMFRAARAANRQDILSDPERAIREYIRDEKLGKFRKAQAAKADADKVQQQRMAAMNRARPGAAAFTGGQPAPARSNHRRTIRDVNRELIGRSLA